MTDAPDTADSRQRFQELLGYLNFSAGAVDKRFLANLNHLFGEVEHESTSHGAWQRVRARLVAELDKLEQTSPVFKDARQAKAVLRLVFDDFLPAYREFHRDLLYHQTDDALWRPFFLGRVFEVVLRDGPPWDEAKRSIPEAIARLNDYVGHRPVAVLHNGRRAEPYPHEWTRPSPLYIQGAGVAVGRYAALIKAAFELLAGADANLAAAAHFDLAALEELALDLRAYEFDHPANKRPNHHFGQWDPHLIDNRGFYRRFVLQQVTLDALVSRVEEPGESSVAERLFEGAAVLAGVVLMSSAVCGSGPGAHDSNVSLATLLPRVAANRDAFYEQLIRDLDGERGKRLRDEAQIGRQPLAGARQHLNHTLVRRRATQLEQVHLALLYARMGHREAALAQAQTVSVASARMRCEIQCRITAGELAVAAGRVDDAATLLVEAEDFLHRAIECGAMIDPWSILGFQTQFSLFPSPDNSVHDHRADQLIELTEAIFSLFARVWSEAAAQDRAQVVEQVSAAMMKLADWWDQFATPTVSNLESFSAKEAVESARQVAEALRAWRQGGAATGDIAFWRKRVLEFQSAKAYGLVVEALLDKHDLVAARALLVQWSSQAGLAPLKLGSHSFHTLAKRWLSAALQSESEATGPAGGKATSLAPSFFDHLEANAEYFWAAPSLSIGEPADAPTSEHEQLAAAGDADDELGEDDEGGLYRAAYDEMVYQDSTADGNDSDMLETPGLQTDHEMENENRRLEERLTFLSTVATLWKRVAIASVAGMSADQRDRRRAPLPVEAAHHWRDQARKFEADLLRLIDAAEALRVPAPSANRESLLEFERRRSLKESILETVIATTVAIGDSRRWLAMADPELPTEPAGPGPRRSGERGKRSSQAAPGQAAPGQALPTPGGAQASRRGGAAELAIEARVFHAILRGSKATVQSLWPGWLEELQKTPLLYVPLHKGGSARSIVAARQSQQRLRDLLACLPRLGMVRQTCQLIAAARVMENDHPVGANAVTEFDRLFSVGYRALVETLAEVSRAWAGPQPGERADRDLVDCLETLTESLLKQWSAHSRTLRLSTLERIGSDREWQMLVGFIERYGHSLFTQRFMNPGNLRAILRQGVEPWLARLQEEPPSDEELNLLDDLDSGEIKRTDAARCVGIVLEAVLENYSEYRDYNSTTTQSDRGELIYTLLDFLRLRVHYDRVAWHLRPVLLAHEILVRKQRMEAAELWRRALADRTAEVADSLLSRYEDLRRRYGMRLPTVADRLAERFVRPLSVDRLRALVRPAMDEVLAGEPAVAFEVLRQEAAELTLEPTGAGLDVPQWLQALENEVESATRPAGDDDLDSIPQAPMTLSEMQRELTALDEPLD